MSITAAYNRLSSELSGPVRRDEPMSRHTTFRIGGPSDLYVQADTVSDLACATTVLTEQSIPWTVLGKGSNVLVADGGYRGAMLVLGRDFRRHAIEDGTLRSGCAVALATIVQDAFAAGLSGLEFAVGIPGTVGGALAMNAGSREDWIGSVVESVTLFSPGRGLVGVRGHEVRWGYRRTDLPARGIIVESVLRLAEGDAERIRRSMEASLNRRKRSQPLGMPNAGSIFVNPDGDSAGRLIEQAGLKGAREGGAQISETHANFIVNVGGATAHDVAFLIRRVRDAVRDMNGIELTPEIRFLGSFDVS